MKKVANGTTIWVFIQDGAQPSTSSSLTWRKSLMNNLVNTLIPALAVHDAQNLEDKSLLVV
jgi:hypothetical protein